MIQLLPTRYSTPNIEANRLGPAICRMIFDRHGGNLTIHSGSSSRPIGLRTSFASPQRV